MKIFPLSLRGSCLAYLIGRGTSHVMMGENFSHEKTPIEARAAVGVISSVLNLMFRL